MFDGRFGTVFVVAFFVGGSAYAAPEQTACPTGELTNQRLASEICMDRIPLPSARPGQDTASATSEAEPPVEYEYIETPGLEPGEIRTVRLVGPRFLPDVDEESRIRQTMTQSGNNGWEQVVHYAASWLGITSDRPEQNENRQTADADDERRVLDMADSSGNTLTIAR